MSTTNFRALEQEINESLFPHKVISVRDLHHIGQDIFSLNGQNIAFNEESLKFFDKIVGLSSRQSQAIIKASGEKTFSDFRNYMNLANSIDQDLKILMFADPENKMISRILPMKADYIPISSFIDFCEILAEDLDCSIEDIDWQGRDNAKVTINLHPNNPNIVNLGGIEEFISNGLFVEWQPNQVKLGSYVIRRVCVNGQVITSSKSMESFNSLNAEDFQKHLKRIKERIEVGKDFERFKEKVIVAQQSQTSLKELERVHKFMSQIITDKKQLEELFPYSDEAMAYISAGYDLDRSSAKIVSHLKVWDLYNRLTAFATHNPIEQNSNLHSSDILFEAQHLLYKNRDIEHYHNLYG